MKKWLGLLLIFTVLGGIFYVKKQRAGQNLPDFIAHSNGRLELARFDVASLHAGRIQEMHVDEGSLVGEGDVIAQLSSHIASSRVEEAQAGQLAADGSVARAQAAEKQAREAMARADAQIVAQQQQLKLAQMEWENASRLQNENLVSPAETQRRRSQRDGAQAALKAAQAAKAEAQAAIAQAQAAVSEAKAGVLAREAQLKAAQSANDDMLIRSPKSGRVEYKLAQVGSVIGAGSNVVSVLDLGDASMNIFLPNHQMAKLKVGDDARIVLDGLDAVFPAKISFIASNAQFTPKAVETQSERAKLMFKVKLRMPQETALQYQNLIKGGMTGNGYVRTDTSRDWGDKLAVKLPAVSASSVSAP